MPTHKVYEVASSAKSSVSDVTRITTVNKSTGQIESGLNYARSDTQKALEKLGLDTNQFLGKIHNISTVDQVASFIEDGATAVVNGVSYAVNEVLDNSMAAVESLGSFLAENAGNFSAELFSKETFSQSVGEFFGGIGQKLLNGTLDADKAFVEFTRIMVRNETGKILGEGISKTLAFVELKNVFKNNFGYTEKEAGIFANTVTQTFARIGTTFVLDSQGWDSKQYVQSGVSIITSAATTYYLTTQAGSLFGNQLAIGSELTPLGGGVVAGVTSLIGGIIGGQNVGQIAMSVGVSAGTTFASSYAASLVAPAITGQLAGTALGNLLGVTAVTSQTIGLVANVFAPVIGIVIGYVIGKVIGSLFGSGKVYGPGEFETLQQLKDSEWQIVTLPDGQKAIQATSRDGTTIILGDGIKVGIGNPGQDTIAGGNEDNIIQGGGGDDFLDGRGGNDGLMGEDGDDHLEGGAGDDFSNGGLGNDIVFGGDGKDTLQGDKGNDFNNGGAGDDLIIGGDGQDAISGGAGDDAIEADGTDLNASFAPGTRDDVVDAGAGDDTVSGGDGNDTLQGGDGNDVIEGGAGDDNIFGGNDKDQLFGGDGKDLIHGGAEDDIMDGQIGDDYLLGADGGDFITGGIGNDVVDGGTGNDVLLGEVGNDIIYGGEGDDSILTGFGDDILLGGKGNDTLSGEDGNDLYFAIDGDGKDTISDDEGINQIYFSDAAMSDLTIKAVGNNLVLTTTKNGLTEITITDYWSNRNFNALYFADGKQVLLDRLQYPATGETVSFSTASDASDKLVNLEATLKNVMTNVEERMSVNATNADSTWSSSNYMTGGVAIPDTATHYNEIVPVTYKKSRGKFGGHYTVHGKDHPELLADMGDRVVGSWWNEHIIGSGKAEAFYGNGGSDEIETGDGNDLAFGGSGSDAILGGNGNDYLMGGTGDDAPLHGEAGNDTIYGGDGNDLIRGDNDGQSYDDLAYGGGGDDRVYGGGGQDLIFGESGHDTIDGGNGKDVLVGGAGNDTLYGDKEIRLEPVYLLGVFRGYQPVEDSTGDSDVIYGGDGDDTIYAETRLTTYTRALSYGLVLETVTIHNNETADNYLSGGNGNDKIYGAWGDDMMIGGSGADWLEGSRGADEINGGDGNDIALGGEGDDLMYGGDESASTASGAGAVGISAAVNDVLYGHQGSDFIVGGAGNDYIVGDQFAGTESVAESLRTYANTTGARDYLYGGDGNDEIHGNGGNDFIIGGDGNDVSYGGQGNDEIFGSDGDDSLFGEAGNDTIAGGSGRDRIDGGDGIDTLTFTDQITPYGITAILFNNEGHGAIHVAADADHINLTKVEFSGTWQDSFSGIENLTGSYGNDRLWGNDLANILIGLAGNDTLTGGSGADTLDGGDGIDTAAYAASKTSITINLGNLVGAQGTTGDALGDKLIGIENIIGGEGHDTITGNGLANFLYGGLGNDTIFGGAGNDQIFGEGGDNTLGGDAGDDILYGYTGNDVISGGLGNDKISGWIGNDILSGNDGGDTFYGDAGNDTISGDNGDDFIYAGDDNDTAYGGAGRDYLFGDTGNDILSGQGDDDQIFGGDGNDKIYGSTGNDQMNGGKDDDIIWADEGDDLIYEDDIASSGNDTFYGGTGDDTISSGGGNDLVTGDDGNDHISGNSGDDTIYGGSGEDKLFGNDGNDSISGGIEDDNINGGSGNDTLYGEDGNDKVLGGAGNDKIYGAIGDDRLYGLSGDDTVYGGDGVDVIYADDGNDAVYGDDGNDTISGWGGNDKLDGGLGNDFILGENGSDVLYGGGGNDILYGDRKHSGPTSTTAEQTVIDNVFSKLGIKNYGLLYQGANYTKEALSAAPHDLLIIPMGKAMTPGGTEILWSTQEIQDIKNSGDGKLLIGYIDTGRINTFSQSWDSTWVDGNGVPKPQHDWLVGRVGSSNAYAVNYWEPEWETILFNRLDKLIDQGFNGVFLDDVMDYFVRRGDNPNNIAQAAQEMRDLILSLRKHADEKIDSLPGDKDPEDFLFIVNGAPFLISDGNHGDVDLLTQKDRDYFNAIDAILAENYFSLNYSYAWEKVISEFGSRGIPMLSIDTDLITLQQRIELMKLAVSKGFMPYVTEDMAYNVLNEAFVPGYGDTISDGNDILIGGDGADQLIGGNGIDRAQYSDATAGVIADLHNQLVNTGYALGDRYTSIENLSGSKFNDDLRGNAFDNTIWGNGGNDIITGRDGNDTLIGGTGSDQLVGGNGVDTADYANAAAAVTASLSAPSTNTGEAAGDTYIAIENLSGSAFNDVLTGNANQNTLYGKAGDDSLSGGADNDILLGEDGDDILIGGAGADQLIGGNGTDCAKYIDATAAVTVDLSNAALNTGFALGDTYNSIENLYGSKFNDTLRGNALNNVIWAYMGNDSLQGGDGNDKLSGGAGADSLDGGSGIDTASYADSASEVIADLLSSTTNSGDAAGDTYVYIENLEGSAYNDTLRANNTANTIYGGAGNDLIVARAGNDVLYGDDGNDVLLGGAGADHLYGGTGTDTADYRDAAASVLVDLLAPLVNTGNAAGDIFDSIENLTGSTYGDSLRGNNFANTIRGGSGNDTIHGRSGNDILYGDAGNDILYGGLGQDVLYGGAGADQFRFARNDSPLSVIVGSTIPTLNSDKIADFKLSEGDRLVFDNILSFNPVSDAIENFIAAKTVGANTLLTGYDHGNILTPVFSVMLQNVVNVDVDKLYKDGIISLV